MEQPWSNSFWACFDPFDTCLMGCFCPCFLFGHTQARNKGEADPSWCNMDCCAWYCLMQFCAAGPCLQAIKRSDIRAKFHLEGSCLTDWAGACCCTCCALIQEEKESLLRANNSNNNNEKMGYAPPQGMNYGPQQNGPNAGPQHV